MVREIKELYGIIHSSKIRLNILKTLSKNSPLLQSKIASLINKNQQDISKEIKRLIDEELIECLNKEKKSYKLYIITELGRDVLRYKL